MSQKSTKESTATILEESLKMDLTNLLSSAEDENQKDEWKSNFSVFENLYDNFLESEPLKWEDIAPPSESMIAYYSPDHNLSNDEIRAHLQKLVVVKLNGGLGTTMGCSGPKSLVKIRDGLTFLDITVNHLEYINQKYGVSVPLVLMNSYNTNAATKKSLVKYRSYETKIHCFSQAICPRIGADTHRPLASSLSLNKKDWWYPPGHGNFYGAFRESGLLDEFIKDGKTVAFVSNIDNLGATIDQCILKTMTQADSSGKCYDFLLEVTDKTKADIKGGTIINYKGAPRLLEIAQVPKAHEEDFKSVNTFKIFNTNNIWVKLDAIKNTIDSTSKLDIIVNKKTLASGEQVIQLETAIGAAMKLFKNAISMNVPRCRFLPVKNNSDLFLVQSNIYVLTKSGLVMNEKRQFQTTPYVKLSGNHFQEVDQYQKRFSSIPDVLELDHLTVSGNVTFGSNITFKGTVIIIAQEGQRIDIPSGAVLENKLVSGNLTIISH